MKRTSNHSEQRLFREEVLSFTSHIYMTLAILCRRRHKVAFKSRTESEIQFAIPSAKGCLRNGEYGKDGRGRKKNKGMGGRGDFPHL